MSIIVQKFGGSSVADAERVNRVAGIIADTYRSGHDVVVVVSAQGDQGNLESGVTVNWL